MSDPKCIVCGKPIPKVLRTYYIRKPTETYPHGTRRNYSQHGTTLELYLDPPPKSRDEAARLVNGDVRSVRYSEHEFGERAVWQFSEWDGESYTDEFFDNDRCAVKQGYAAARAGYRWTWGKG